jgi:hypothetical protein
MRKGLREESFHLFFMAVGRSFLICSNEKSNSRITSSNFAILILSHFLSVIFPPPSLFLIQPSTFSPFYSVPLPPLPLPSNPSPSHFLFSHFLSCPSYPTLTHPPLFYSVLIIPIFLFSFSSLFLYNPYPSQSPSLIPPPLHQSNLYYSHSLSQSSSFMPLFHPTNPS